MLDLVRREAGLGRSAGLSTSVVAEEEEKGELTSKVVIVGSYSVCSCADSDWPDWDQGSAMPRASFWSAERGSLPAPAAAGTHQLCLSVKVALQE